MLKNFILLFFLLIFTGGKASAGGIRTVYVDSSKMVTIYLRMGQSTVLRFREKPKKVVVGNSNYFNVEYIDNDLTIQPLGEVNTNLFLYGEYHTFGFNLKVNVGSRFDDLVNVRWKSKTSPKREPKAQRDSKFKRIGTTHRFDDDLTLKFVSIEQNENLNSTIFDLELINTSKNKINTSSLDVKLTRSKKKFAGVKFAFRDDEVLPNKSTRIRFVVSPRQKKGFSFELKRKDKSFKKIISRKYL